MALINRLSRLFQADLHAVLDRIEEPDVLLKQAVREMEDELAACEQRIRCMQQHQQQLLQREADIEQSLLRIEEELGICFGSGNDKLARGLVKRKLEAQLFLKSVVRKREALEKTLREQSVRFEENRVQFESMRQKSELLTEEMQADASRRNDPLMMTMTEFSVRDDEVEVAMLREKQQYEKRSKS